MSEKHIPGNLEIFLNEQRADLQVMHMIVQMFLMRMLDTMPPQAAEASVADMENMIGHVLSSTPATGPDIERIQQLTISRAEMFFQNLRKGMQMPPRRNPAGSGKGN